MTVVLSSPRELRECAERHYLRVRAERADRPLPMQGASDFSVSQAGGERSDKVFHTLARPRAGKLRGERFDPQLQCYVQQPRQWRCEDERRRVSVYRMQDQSSDGELWEVRDRMTGVRLGRCRGVALWALAEAGKLAECHGCGLADVHVVRVAEG